MKRTPIARKTPMRREGPTAPRERKPMARSLTSAQPHEPKEGACAHCGKPFLKLLPMQRVCGPVCAGRKARAERTAKQKAEREQTRARRAALKTIPDLIREAQTAFNAWVRARDEGKPCICCGRMADDRDLITGSRWDAGHYRSTGSAPHLRFHEDNAHRQLVHCNRHGAGRAVNYRIGLIARIGLARVEALDAANQVHKWTREELIALKAHYRARLRELTKEKA